MGGEGEKRYAEGGGNHAKRSPQYLYDSAGRKKIANFSVAKKNRTSANGYVRVHPADSKQDGLRGSIEFKDLVIKFADEGARPSESFRKRAKDSQGKNDRAAITRKSPGKGNRNQLKTRDCS